MLTIFDHNLTGNDEEFLVLQNGAFDGFVTFMFYDKNKEINIESMFESRVETITSTMVKLQNQVAVLHD